MKIKHLFTFCVLLALIGSGILLTQVSSIAQDTRSRKTTTPAASNSLYMTPAANNSVKGVSRTDDALPIPLIISSLSGLLHLLEIAGLVWAYLKIQQLIEKGRDSRSQIKSLVNRLNASEQKQKVQIDQLNTIRVEAAKAQQASLGKFNDIVYAIPALEKAATTPPQREAETLESMNNSSYLIPKFQGIDVGISLPRYPFLDTYRQNPDNFKNQYAPKTVSEDADNLQKRRAGDHQEIILDEDRQGNYWLFKDGTITYLIPSPKLKVNDLNIRTAGALFDCDNYTPGYQSITVMLPAIVSSQFGNNKCWKLEQKGALEFT